MPFSGFFEIFFNLDGSGISETLHEQANLLSAKVFTPDVIAPGTKMGVWVWQRKYVADTWEHILMLDFCRLHGIGSIFIQVHFDETDNGDDIWADLQAWNKLLVMANALGIKIEALDGAPGMAFKINRPSIIGRLNAVFDFHLAQPENARFLGIHYDIEPYTTPEWNSGRHHKVALELLETLSELRRIISEADALLTFANDIPFWYDGNEDYLLEFEGTTKYLNEHIQDLSDFTGIMSYRTKMTGSNSTSEITSGELAYGAKIGRPVYLAIETVELPDTPQITFYGKSAVDVASAIRELNEELKYAPSFGGIFLHEYETLRLIGDQWDLSGIN